MPGATAAAEDCAMVRALELARRGPAAGPNPRVGCVLLDRTGRVLGEGWHAGAGTPHAEVAALADAEFHGASARDATAVVTLEPCHHSGRTGPCTAALVEAGVRRVVHSVDDPNPTARGGAAALRDAGVDVVSGLRRAEGVALLETWLHALRTGRPWITLKTATSLDGRVTAADGTSRWITGAESRTHAHRVRAEVDAIVVGTGTVLADDPELTARDGEALARHQPARVVVGRRPVPERACLRGPGGELMTLATHDVHEVLEALTRAEVRHALVEGGPTLASAFLRAGVVDEIHAYLAPVLLGAGRPALEDVGVPTLSAAPRWRTVDVRRLGADVLVVTRPDSSSPTQEEV